MVGNAVVRLCRDNCGGGAVALADRTAAYRSAWPLGRYRVQLDIAHNPHLREWYAFHWQLIGNLGVDLLVIPLSKLFGLELAVKLIVIAIPVTMVGALLMIAREVHGESQPPRCSRCRSLTAIRFTTGLPTSRCR